MASVPIMRRRYDASQEIPPLENGDRLNQQEFHRRYEAMPEHVKAELIGGVVHMPSPAKARHSRPHGILSAWLGAYEVGTIGVEFYVGPTVILGVDSEPEPDAALIYVDGNARINDDDYLVGPPELAAEIASSSESIDLHAKRADYEKAGVKEYIVVAVRQKKVFWWIRRGRKFVKLSPSADGILRSETFPGLWLDPAAIVNNDSRRVLAVLRKGLASPEHAAFVKRMTAAKK